MQGQESFGQARDSGARIEKVPSSGGVIGGGGNAHKVEVINSASSAFGQFVRDKQSMLQTKRLASPNYQNPYPSVHQIDAMSLSFGSRKSVVADAAPGAMSKTQYNWQQNPQSIVPHKPEISGFHDS